MTDEEREDLNTFKHDLVKQARWWQWKAEALEKESEQLKAENAALHERLEKTVELPFLQKDGEVIVLIYKDKEGVVFTEKYFTDEYYGEKKGEEAAKSRLEEIRKDG